MREIKFRGKKISDSKWNFGVPYRSEGTWWMLVDDNTRTQEIGTGSYQIIPETVGQFTGLKDKNGKLIYEGDIVKAWSEGYCGTFEVRWREDGGGSPMYILYPAWQNKEMWFLCSTREKDGECYDRGLEIVGNIHDNPELLEV